MINMSQDTTNDSFFEAILKPAQTIYGQAGTPEAKLRLKEAATGRMKRLDLNSYSAYGDRLKKDPGEWNYLWAVSIPAYGAFLRPPVQFEVVGDLISEWAVMSPARELKVLSLGCGLGFETVSLAICLEESGLRSKNWQVNIYGLDLNPEAIKFAENGIFTSDDLEWLAESQRRKWFNPRGGGFSFKADLAPAIEVAQGNVYEPETWPFSNLGGSFDLIFCRGLSLEAPPEAIRLLSGILRRNLSLSGFIFTAPGEFLPLVADEITLEERSGVTYYRRGPVKIKVNRQHQPRRLQKQAPQNDKGQDKPGQAGKKALPLREAQLLFVAEKELTKGHWEAARALADEAVLAALERECPAPEAWMLVAKIEERLGREDTARATMEAAQAVKTLSGRQS